MKKLLLVGALLLSLTLSACGGAKKEETKESAKDDNKIVIGVSPTPHAEIIEGLQDEFKKAGLDVEAVNFDDYVQPNLQLSSADIDANYFQHEPYFNEFTKERKIDNLSILGFVHTEPMAVYSKSLKDLKDLKDGDEIIIPNDPTNGARALILLEEAGVIKLKDKNNFNSTENDILENPKNIKFVAMDAPTIPKSYTDAAAAVINSNYAIGAELDPAKDSIFLEKKDSPYANLVAVRTEDKDKEKFKKLIEVLNSEACKKLIEEKFNGVIFPAF